MTQNHSSNRPEPGIRKRMSGARRLAWSAGLGILLFGAGYLIHDSGLMSFSFTSEKGGITQIGSQVYTREAMESDRKTHQADRAAPQPACQSVPMAITHLHRKTVFLTVPTAMPSSEAAPSSWKRRPWCPSTSAIRSLASIATLMPDAEKIQLPCGAPMCVIQRTEARQSQSVPSRTASRAVSRTQ